MGYTPAQLQSIKDANIAAADRVNADQPIYDALKNTGEVGIWPRMQALPGQAMTGLNLWLANTQNPELQALNRKAQFSGQGVEAPSAVDQQIESKRNDALNIWKQLQNQK